MEVEKETSKLKRLLLLIMESYEKKLGGDPTWERDFKDSRKLASEMYKENEQLYREDQSIPGPSAENL